MSLPYGAGPVAFVFPGQGSQYVGMGKALFDVSETARQVFKRADEILGFALTRMCFEGPEQDLNDTINAQPAILTVSIACLNVLRERWQSMGQVIAPQYVAGHSLGEFTALVAADVIDFENALVLVRERGRLMKENGTLRPGGMLAVLGLDKDLLEGSSPKPARLASSPWPTRTLLDRSCSPAKARRWIAPRSSPARAAPPGSCGCRSASP